MGKLDDLRRTAAANVAESVGAGRPALRVADTPGPPRKKRDEKGFLIAPAMIDPDPNQPRQEFDEARLDELAASLKASGQLEPIGVVEMPGGRYRIVYGERRWRAAGRAGLEYLRCTLIDAGQEPAEILIVQLAENMQRADLRPVEQAAKFRELVDLGWKKNAIAARIGVDPATIGRTLELLDLPPATLGLVKEGSLPPSTALEIATLGDPARIDELAGSAVEKGWSRAETKREVARILAPPVPTAIDPLALSPSPELLATDAGKLHGAISDGQADWSGESDPVGQDLPASEALPVRQEDPATDRLYAVKPKGVDTPVYFVRADGASEVRAYVDAQHPGQDKLKLEVWEWHEPVPGNAWVRDLNASPPKPAATPAEVANEPEPKSEPEADPFPAAKGRTAPESADKPAVKFERFTFIDRRTPGNHVEIQWRGDQDPFLLLSAFRDAFNEEIEGRKLYKPGTAVRIEDKKHRLHGYEGRIVSQIADGLYSVALDAFKGESSAYAASQLALLDSKLRRSR